MVNRGSTLTCVKKYIEKEKLERMMPWSLRTKSNRKTKSGSMNCRIKDLRYILDIVSGGDIVEMLKDTLTIKERELLTLDKYKNALANLSEHYNQSPVKQRHNIVRPLKLANLKRAQLRRLGFATGKKLWKSCMNKEERNLGGGLGIPNHLKCAINQYLKEKSRIASNRLVSIKDANDAQYKEKVPARYLEDRISELWKSFPLKDQLARITFYKYVRQSGTFKKPIRLSDLCEYCEEGIRLREKLIQGLKDYGHSLEETVDFEMQLNYFKQQRSELHKQQLILKDEAMLQPVKANLDKVNQLVDYLEDYVAIQFHQNISKTQRSAYNEHRKNVEMLRGKILVEMDYKEKIVIGLSPRQINSEYYKQTIRTCLGFGIYYVNENNTIELINVDIISSDLKQDADATVRGLRFLREQDFFKQVEQKEYIVWADCGKHFKCSKVMSYLLNDLAAGGIHVNLNFFCEKHGKASRDAHFSNVSKFIHDESLVVKLESSQDIANAINKRQRLANENKDKQPITTYALVLDDETRRRLDIIPILKHLKILHIERFYNFRTIGENFKIATSALSINDHVSYVRVYNAREDVDEEADRINKEVDEKIVAHCQILQAKKRLSSLLQRIKNEAISKQKDTNAIFYKPFEAECENGNTAIIGEDVEASPLPQYCRQSPGTPQKPGCAQCKMPCTYKIEDLLHPTLRISKNDILEELKYHHHPKCRVVNGQQRDTEGAAKELADHYIFAHNQNEPKFF